MRAPELILGPPGSGKTTRLLDIAEREMSEGVAPGEIAFVTFTRAGAREASQRAARRFSLDPAVDLPWYRTLHSLAYRQLGIAREEVMGPRDWAEFSLLVGSEVSSTRIDPTEFALGESGAGNLMLRMVDLAATTQRSLMEIWRELDEPVTWYEVLKFAEAYAAYKQDTGKMDFNDMLSEYAVRGTPVPVRVAIIDEGQDLTAAQWAAARRAFGGAERVYIAGDDDQAIYRWAGADMDTFLTLSATPTILQQSYRLPWSIFELSQQIASRISRRYAKAYAPMTHEGGVYRHMSPEVVDLKELEGSWLLLARNNYMLGVLEEMAQGLGMHYARHGVPAVKPTDIEAITLWEQLRGGKLRDLSAPQVRQLSEALGLPRPTVRELSRYAIPEEWPRGVIWHEALRGIPSGRRDYYVSCLRRGEKLKGPPRVRIETIHGAKGAEADHVLLLTDMSERTWRGFQQDPDAEHRVFYVGVTRARHTLHLIQPQSVRSYPVS